MKKLIALLALAGSFAAFASLDVVHDTRRIQVLAPTTISAGTTNAVQLEVIGLKGIAGVYVNAGAAFGRSIDVTVLNTNAVAGGWSVYAHGVCTQTNSCVYALPFSAEYLSKPFKVEIGGIGANSAVSAFILGY